MTTFVEGKKKKVKKQFEKMFKLKAMQSMCVPGEPVGLLAAQVKTCTKRPLNKQTTNDNYGLVDWRTFHTNDAEHVPFRWQR